VPEIGDRIAQSVVDYFAHDENQEMLQRLKAAGLQFALDEAKLELMTDKLAGLSFVISGVFEKYGRDELKDLIKNNGGKVVSSISKKLDYLVAGENMGPAKLEKATKLEVKIISEAEFDKMLTA
jgi:DNA ligase (NAD+)